MKECSVCKAQRRAPGSQRAQGLKSGNLMCPITPAKMVSFSGGGGCLKQKRTHCRHLGNIENIYHFAGWPAMNTNRVNAKIMEAGIQFLLWKPRLGKNKRSSILSNVSLVFIYCFGFRAMAVTQCSGLLLVVVSGSPCYQGRDQIQVFCIQSMHSASLWPTFFWPSIQLTYFGGIELWGAYLVVLKAYFCLCVHRLFLTALGRAYTSTRDQTQISCIQSKYLTFINTLKDGRTFAWLNQDEHQFNPWHPIWLPQARSDFLV